MADNKNRKIGLLKNGKEHDQSVLLQTYIVGGFMVISPDDGYG